MFYKLAERTKTIYQVILGIISFPLVIGIGLGVYVIIKTAICSSAKEFFIDSLQAFPTIYVKELDALGGWLIFSIIIYFPTYIFQKVFISKFFDSFGEKISTTVSSPGKKFFFISLIIVLCLITAFLPYFSFFHILVGQGFFSEWGDFLSYCSEPSRSHLLFSQIVSLAIAKHGGKPLKFQLISQAISVGEIPEDFWDFVVRVFAGSFWLATLIAVVIEIFYFLKQKFKVGPKNQKN